MKAQEIINDLMTVKSTVQLHALVTGERIGLTRTITTVIDNTVKYIRENQPSEPPVATWLYREGFSRIQAKRAYIQGECSNCGCRPLTRFPAGKPWAYCPNCGAQMQ